VTNEPRPYDVENNRVLMWQQNVCIVCCEVQQGGRSATVNDLSPKMLL